MAVTGWPTDTGAGQVATEDRWVQMARLWTPEGVVDGVTNELAPSFAAGQVTVQTGAAWINGHYATNDAPVVVATAANGLVVLRYTVAGNVFAIVFNSGATVPTQTAAVWEIPLALVTSGVMTDRRQFTGGGTGWQPFTPAPVNITVGSGGVQVARYVQHGRTVHYFWGFLFGTGSSIGGGVTINLPVPINPAWLLGGTANTAIIAHGICQDLSATDFQSLGFASAGNTSLIGAWNATGNIVGLGTTSPFTWTTGDSINVVGTYEAA